MMMDYLYPNQPSKPEMKIVDVMVCKMRRKLSQFGVEITTHHGRGYYLDPSVKRQIEEYLQVERG